MILAEIGVHETPEIVIEQRFLVQRHADAPHHAAHDLAARGLRIEDAPGRDRVARSSTDRRFESFQRWRDQADGNLAESAVLNAFAV